MKNVKKTIKRIIFLLTLPTTIIAVGYIVFTFNAVKGSF